LFCVCCLSCCKSSVDQPTDVAPTNFSPSGLVRGESTAPRIPCLKCVFNGAYLPSSGWPPPMPFFFWCPPPRRDPSCSVPCSRDLVPSAWTRLFKVFFFSDPTDLPRLYYRCPSLNFYDWPSLALSAESKFFFCSVLCATPRLAVAFPSEFPRGGFGHSPLPPFTTRLSVVCPGVGGFFFIACPVPRTFSTRGVTPAPTCFRLPCGLLV